MKRLVTAWAVALLALAALGVWRGGIESGAQQTSTPQARNGTELTESESLLLEIANLQQDQDELLAELAAAQATEVANLAATVVALDEQVVAAEATGAALAGEVGALQTQVAELETAQTGSPGSVPGIEVGIGEVANAGAWDITVTGVEFGDSIEPADPADEPAEAQGVFVLVALEIVNTGTDAQTYDPTWFQIMDDRGRNWPFDFTQTDALALADVGARQYQAIEPGLPATAVVVFDIATDATGLTFGTIEDLSFTGEPQPNPFTVRLEE